MNLFLIVIVALTSSFGNATSTQSRARDTERQTDIKATHAHLEAYYAENGFYPTESALITRHAELMRGLDAASLEDPTGKRINTNGDYTYRALECSGKQCADYTLTAKLESGELYEKRSLNGPSAPDYLKRN